MDVVLTTGLMTFILIFSRLGALLTLMPIFGNQNAPGRFKVAFAAIVSFLFLMSGIYSVSVDFNNLASFAMAIVSEVLNGLAMGLVVTMVMNAIYIAGHIIDLNMGFGMARVISPVGGAQIALTANFYFMLTMLLFVITNAHHFMIRALARSFDLVPLGVMGINQLHVDGFVNMFVESFIVGFQIAMPIVTTVLVANIVLGLLSKAMPGMNVFMVGMPFKILIGLATLFVILPVNYQMIIAVINRIGEYMTQVVNAMQFR